MSTILLKIITFCITLLSWRGAQRFGGCLGLIWFYVIRIRRRVVFGNLAMALPERAPSWKAIARGAYRHFGISFLEFLKMGQMPLEKITSMMHTSGLEHFERAHARGRGVIVVTAHFGNFDLLAYSAAASGIPLAIVSRDLRARGTNRFWMRTRKKSGLEIFPAEGSARGLLDWLRRGNVVGLTVDQRTPESRGGILSDFMGWQVWTTTAPAALAHASGAALIPVHVERGADGTHNMIIEPEIPRSGEEKGRMTRQVTEQINRVVEHWVCRRPDHWLWLHRRFVGAKSKHELESSSMKG